MVRADEDRTPPPFLTEFDSQVKEEDESHEHRHDANVSFVGNDDNATPRRKTSLLLPSPPDTSIENMQSPDRVVQLRMKLIEKVLGVFVQHQLLLAKLVKNSILVGKVSVNEKDCCRESTELIASVFLQVLSISRMCPESYGFPREWVTSMLLGIALVDAVVDMGLLMHIGCLVFHILVIKFGCIYIRCCV